MAALSDSDRIDVWAQWMRDVSAPDLRQPIAITKTDLRAAVNAIDDWIDANAVAFNNALPAAAKTVLTQAQKMRLFVLIITKRWGGL